MAASRKIYTKTGDDGTTGLLFGGRVAKDSALPSAYGSVDEAQAVLGLARVHAIGELERLLVPLIRDLWVLMAELATAPENRERLEPGVTAVSQEMVDALETRIDELDETFQPPTEFVVPGGNVTAAWLDLARTVVRRAERLALAAAPAPSLVGPYLNRLSDLLWMMARHQDASDGSTLRATRRLSRQTGGVTATNLPPTAPTSFDPVPSRAQPGVSIVVSGRVPADAGVVGVPVAATGPVPRQLGVDRATLAASGFDGKIGETLVVPRRGGPSVVAVGIGDPATVDVAGLRDAAAAFARAAGKHTEIATTLTDLAGVAPEVAGQVVAEGILLARYRYRTLKRDAGAAPLTGITLVAGSARAPAVARGVERGKVIAGAAQLARDLANTPPGHLTASRMADVAVQVAGGSGLAVEVYGAEDIGALGCGGLLGVNAGSTEPPRLVKLTYTPRSSSGRARKPTAHLALVGKGVMYDSGGISLKPTDAMHAAMKMDMSGAAAVLASMSALAALDCRTAVTGYLLCTDNMPSGSAMKLGDVLTIHGGTTVEVHNTDAEGRLLLADGLAMATEERPDAVVDIATLTGACMVALGPSVAGVLGNDQGLIDQVTAAAATTDEAIWQLPLERRRYRKLLDSDIADVKNVGGPHGGAITAAVFLSEFVGDLPWAHLDIAGPMKVDADESWRSKGATGFGTRLLIELASSFTNGAHGRSSD